MARNTRKKFIVWEFDRKDGKNTTVGVQLGIYDTISEARAYQAELVAKWHCSEHKDCSDRFVVRKDYPIEIEA